MTMPLRTNGASSSLADTSDAALVRRADTDVDHRQSMPSHDLSGRAVSMPHTGSLPPRGGVPGANQDREVMLPSRERSDRYSEVSIAAHWDSASEARSEPPPAQGGADAAAEPPPARSWRAAVTAAFQDAGAMLNHLAQGAATRVVDQAKVAAQQVLDVTSRAAGSVASEVADHAAALNLLNPGSRLAGAAAGHLIHQSITVGVPTFLREMMAEALILSLRHMPPHHALGLQAGMAAINIGAQSLRRHRENRNPDAAARGFHAMTREKWNALPEEAKAQKRAQQQAHSKMVSQLQIVASATHLLVGQLAARGAHPDNERAGRLFVTDFKAMLYSGMRDSLQASFSMVDTAGPTAGGVSGTHMVASAKFYAMANAVGNHAFSYLPPAVPGVAAADEVLRGTSTAMTRGEAWQVKAAVSAVKAAINTAVEAADWFSVTQHEAQQAGTVQHWSPKLKAFDPERRDYGRLLDQTPARMTAIAAGNAIFNGMGFALKDQPEWARVGVTNLVEAAYEGLKYKSIGGTWQADAAVRDEPTPPRSTARIEELSGPDLEAGTSTAALRHRSAPGGNAGPGAG